MEKEKIKEFLSETKVYVNGKSDKIQEKLFALGCLWARDDTHTIQYIQYTDKPFLFISNTFKLTYGDDMLRFAQHKYREITAEEILALDYPPYRPFKNQEECWNEMLKHQPFGWLKKKDRHEYCDMSKIFDYSGEAKMFVSAGVFTLPQSFKHFVFVDGTPFGIKEG